MASQIIAVQSPFRARGSSSDVKRPDEQEATLISDRSRIVLIGDDPLMLRALNRLLRKAGYPVGMGERPEDYPSVLRSVDNWPDVALTIVDVPDEWSRLAPRQPSIAYERPGRSEDRILWITNAADVVERPDFYLVKPFTASQFLSKVDSALNRWPPKEAR
jgi:DNA-binding response OmpR family regulator